MKHCLLATAVVVLACQAASADLTIDDYSDTDPGNWPTVFSGTSSIAGMSQTNMEGPGLSGVLDGNRTSTLDVQSDTTPGMLARSFSGNITGGTFVFDSDPIVDGRATFDYASATGLDISSAMQFTVDLLSNDVPFPISIKLTDDMGEMSTVTTVSTGGPEMVDFLITAFAAANPLLDLTHIEQIRVLYDGAPASDFISDLVEIIGDVRIPNGMIVPEATSAMMWGVVISCVGGFGFWRRRTGEGDRRGSVHQTPALFDQCPGTTTE